MWGGAGTHTDFHAPDWGSDKMMEELSQMVRNDMQLPANKPLPSLDRGTLHQFTLSSLILGRGRGVKQCGIHHCAVGRGFGLPDAAAEQAGSSGFPTLVLSADTGIFASWSHRAFVLPRPAGQIVPTQGVLHLSFGGQSRKFTPLLETMQTRLQRQICPRPTPTTLHHTTTGSHPRGQRQQLLPLIQYLVPPSRENRMVCRKQGQGKSHRLGRKERH